jgi:hypothetical protein
MSQSTSAKIVRETKESRDRLSNINWDEDKEMTLIRTIYQMGAHFKPGKWNEVLITFMQRYHEYSLFDKSNLMRRLKRKFDGIKADCSRMLSTGNLSAQYSAVMTEKFKIMKIIIAQVEKDKETKLKDKDRRERMDNIEGDVLGDGEDEASYSSDEDNFIEGGMRVCDNDSSTTGKRKQSITNAMVSYLPLHVIPIFKHDLLTYYYMYIEVC